MKSGTDKLSIYYEIALRGRMNINLKNLSNNEPINKSITKYEEVMSILKSGKDKLFQFLYLIWSSVSSLLYEYDSLININEIKINEDNLSDLFYLDLLLLANAEISDLEYSFEFIEKINNIQKKYKEEKFKKIILAKIIIDLINNFNGEENINISLKEIRELNENIIMDNLEYFNNNIGKKNEDFFISNKVDKIYSYIFEELIKKNKFQNYNFVESLLKELDCENIFLTYTISECLEKCLNSTDNFINNYKISNIQELFNDNTKLNFYYLLYKYILKNQFYLYQINILDEFRRLIIDSLKTEEQSIKIQKLLNDKSHENINELIIYIINSYTDSKYYYEKSFKLYLNNLNNDDPSFNKSKLSYGKDEEEAINYLNSYEFRYEVNENENNRDKNRENSIYKEYSEKLVKKDEINIEKINNPFIKKSFKRFNEIIKEFDKNIIELQNLYKDNFIIAFKFEKAKEPENRNYEFYNIICKFYITEMKKSFQIKNVLKKGIIKSQAFLYLKRYLKNGLNAISLYRKDSSTSSIYSSSSNPFSISNNYDKCIYYSFFMIKDHLKKENRYEIMTVEKIIFHHPREAERILELKNNYFLSIGIDNDICIYNSKFNYLGYYTDNKNIKDYINDISNRDTIICSNKGVDILKIDETNFLEIKKFINEPSIFFCKMEDNSYILATKKHIRILAQLNQEINKIEKELAGGIQLGKTNAAFTSNSILPKGQDKIYFYDSGCRQVSDGKLPEQYSFTVSNHSMELMPNNKGEKIFLLCGCKKYKEGQKNGIVLIDLNSLEYEFYETDDFEVFCFCPINIVIEKKSLKNDIDKNSHRSVKNYSTNYFLVGGFETDKKKGAVKLFKLNYEDENNNINNDSHNNSTINYSMINKNFQMIEYVQDIIFEEKTIKQLTLVKNDKDYSKNISDYNFTGFQRNISCITQSKKTGKILITCWDGNVYLFSTPNISYYLEEDDNIMKRKNKKKGIIS